MTKWQGHSLGGETKSVQWTETKTKVSSTGRMGTKSKRERIPNFHVTKKHMMSTYMPTTPGEEICLPAQPFCKKKNKKKKRWKNLHIREMVL